MKITEAVEQCKRSGLKGIELIEFAQRLVGSAMSYSYSNSFDFPSKAFEKGRGYCWQQAGSLNRILKKMGLESRLVYASKNIIPEKVYGGIVVKEHISGHVWCKVRYGGTEKDVCPGNGGNRFGKIHFKPVSKVRDWNPFVCFFSYLGSAYINHRRLRAIERLKTKVETM